MEYYDLNIVNDIINSPNFIKDLEKNIFKEDEKAKKENTDNER